MKRWVVLAVLMAGMLAQAQEVLRMRVLGMPPMSYQDARGNWVGLDVELAQALADEAGVKLSFHTMPWKRAITQLENGELDLMVSLSMTDERKKHIQFIGPSGEETIVLVVPKDSSYDIRALDDLKKLKGSIGIRVGSFYGEEFERKYKTDSAFAAKFEERPVSDMNLKRLDADRIAGYFGNLYGMNYRMRNDPEYSDVKIHPFVIHRDKVYFGLSKKSVSPALMQRLEQAYARAKAAGKFESVLKRYR